MLTKILVGIIIYLVTGVYVIKYFVDKKEEDVKLDDLWIFAIAVILWPVFGCVFYIDDNKDKVIYKGKKKGKK